VRDHGTRYGAEEIPTPCWLHRPLYTTIARPVIFG